MPPAPQPTLGVHLLESITLGMYSDPLHCIREYVQNAYDSIREARRRGLLGEDEGRIELIIDRETSVLKIRDDGVGMSPEEAIVKLVDIGTSHKASTEVGAAKHAGFRGIGRLAGISYCKRLCFETSDGGSKFCKVEFNAEGINALTRPGQPPQTIVDAITENCFAVDLPISAKCRFFEVKLEGVAEPTLLNLEKLEKYLELAAPVRQDPSTWKFQENIKRFAKEAGFPESLEAVRLSLCRPDGSIRREIFRPFKDTFATKNAKSQPKRRVDVTDVVALPRSGDYAGWWGWLAVHERKGAMAGVSFAGLRVRMHNIAIGDHSIVQTLWKTASHALWCFGEIHIVNSDLVPNSQRDNFEPSEAWAKLQEELRAEVTLLEKEIRKESNERNNSVPILTQKANKALKETRKRLDAGLKSHNEKESLLATLQKQRGNLEKGLRRRSRTPEEKIQLNASLSKVKNTYEDVEKVKKTEADATVSHLNRQARKAVQTVLDVVKAELKNDKQFAAIEERVQAALRQGNKDR